MLVWGLVRVDEVVTSARASRLTLMSVINRMRWVLDVEVEDIFHNVVAVEVLLVEDLGGLAVSIILSGLRI